MRIIMLINVFATKQAKTLLQQIPPSELNEHLNNITKSYNTETVKLISAGWITLERLLIVLQPWRWITVEHLLFVLQPWRWMSLRIADNHQRKLCVYQNYEIKQLIKIKLPATNVPEFDLSLMCKLLTNITGIDTSQLRDKRNKFAHSKTFKLTDNEFEKEFTSITKI